MIKSLLHAGCMRELERRAAQKLHAQTPRLYRGHLSSLLSPKSKALDPCGKGTLAALVAGTVWTRTVQRDRGYVVPCLLCPLCESVPDTLRHRVVDCPAVATHRAEWGPEWLLSWADSEEGSQVLAFRGFVPHPGDAMPLPAHDVEHVLEIFDHTQFDGLFGGHVFWDGSATKPAIPELSRAAWAAVVTDDEGTMLARLRGAVPRTLPQTSQAAEVMGVCRSVPRFRKPTVGPAGS